MAGEQAVFDRWWPSTQSIDLIEGDEMEDKMVVVDSKKMSEEIADSGSISLYGIHFESDETAIKQESNPTIEEIAKLLAAEPELKLRVVGHTDTKLEIHVFPLMSQ